MNYTPIMPTIKQKQAFKKIMENRGSVSSTMLEVGYDATTAKNPKNLTDSKGFRELMDQELPDGYLLKKHRKLLDRLNKEGEIDVQAVSKGLDMAYKLGGNYSAEKHLNVNVEIESPEVKELTEKLNELYRKD